MEQHVRVVADRDPGVAQAGHEAVGELLIGGRGVVDVEADDNGLGQRMQQRGGEGALAAGHGGRGSGPGQGGGDRQGGGKPRSRDRRAAGAVRFVAPDDIQCAPRDGGISAPSGTGSGS